MRETLRQLETKRRGVLALKERLRWIIKPSIRMLPPELLSRVFYECWRDGYALRKRGTRSLSEQPNCRTTLTLSQVSAQWRALISQQPLLWSHIRIEIQRDDTSKFAESILEFTKFCLEKSGTTLLIIHFHIPVQGSDKYDQTLHKPILAELFKHCQRWRGAVVNVHDEDVISFPDELPNLRMLVLRRASSSVQSPITLRPVRTPRLHTLNISRMGGLLSSFQDVRALETLSTGESDSDIILGVLKRSPALRKVTLIPDMWISDPDTTEDPIILRLESLDICHSMDCILPWLTLPCLRSLRIHHKDEYHLFNSRKLLDFLRRSQPPLDFLELSGVELEPRQLTLIFHLLPSISVLHYNDNRPFTFHGQRYISPHATKDFIEMITSSATSPSDGVLLPNLTHLSLSLTSAGDSRSSWHGSGMVPPSFFGEGSIIVDMVESRLAGLGGERKLQRFKIECYESLLGREARDRLERLKSQGLDIDIQHRSY
ncbi:hypothetical protein Moror_8255 [Moniliophthora roreri MCA 2997]|uniref:Uncharacterized protein n=2 Tax=Moniliophthora roreri TaxID=221103 RepID=V2XP21_MONRO|nr:hypothetical protein Moror_8255 [Moniliophthora roreri MCA 2997]KAI3607406.1 hypothetical protein WG66_005146 [Moniliophthora roreri]